MAAEQESLSAAQRGKIRRLSTPSEMSADDEAGELNVVPFLDIIMNVLIFVLATISVTFISILDTENTKASDSGSVTANDQQVLQLTVIVSNDGFYVSGEGAFFMPGCEAKATGGKKAYTVGQGTDERGNVSGPDYKALTDCVTKLKNRNANYAQEHEVQIAADWKVQYQVIISTIDAVRGKPAVFGAPPNDKVAVCDVKNGCLFDKPVFTRP